MIWFALAITALIVELFTGTFYLLVFSLALTLTGAIDWAAHSSDAVNFMVCAAFSFIGIVLVARWHKQQKLLPISHDTQYDDLDLGQVVHIVSTDGADFIRVNYRGTQWQAKNIGKTPLQAGQSAVITAREGNVFLIQPKEE